MVDKKGKGPMPFIIWFVTEFLHYKAMLQNVATIEFGAGATAMFKEGMMVSGGIGIAADKQGNIAFYTTTSLINPVNASKEIFNSKSSEYQGSGYALEAELSVKEGYYPGYDNVFDLQRNGYSKAAAIDIADVGVEFSIEYNEFGEKVGYTTSLEGGAPAPPLSAKTSRNGVSSIFVIHRNEIFEINDKRKEIIKNNELEGWKITGLDFKWKDNGGGKIEGVWQLTRTFTTKPEFGKPTTFTKTAELNTGVFIDKNQSVDKVKTDGAVEGK